MSAEAGLKISGVRNVRDYGAKGDGKSNDTAAVQSAVAHLQPYGGTVFFPPGIYLLKQAISISADRPLTVRGEGVGVSRLVWDADAASSGLLISQARPQNLNTDHTTVTGLSLWTRQCNKGVGLKIDLTGQVSHGPNHPPMVVNRVNPRICVEHCELRGENCISQAWNVALHLCNGHHSVISNVHIVGHTSAMDSTAGMLLDGEGHPTEVQISCCWVFNAQRAIWIKGNMEGIKMQQCDLVQVDVGVYCEGCLQMNLLNSHINAHSGCVLARNAKQSCITNNLFYKHGPDKNGFGVQVEGPDAFHNIIANNIFVNVTGDKAVMHAVVLAGNAHHCMVQGNMFTNYGDGVLCLPGASCNNVSGNAFNNPCFNMKGFNAALQGDRSNKVSLS